MIERRRGVRLRIPWGAIRREGVARAGRAARWLRVRRELEAGASHRALFVVGCQRSGTNMVAWTLERSTRVWVHHEHRWSPAFRDYRLRPTPVIERLIARAPASVVAFKPICDAHLTDRLLGRHAGARAIWIFRRYPDVVNSVVRNWPGHAREILRWIVEGDTDWLSWRGERLVPEALSFVHSSFRPEMPDEEAAAVFWWLRNQFFFQLGLERDPRVLLVRYEDLVSSGEEPFHRLFDFAGIPFEPRFREGVSDASIGKRPFPPIDPRVVARCDELLARLEQAHGRSR
jgi:hypothetical protein